MHRADGQRRVRSAPSRGSTHGNAQQVLHETTRRSVKICCGAARGPSAVKKQTAYTDRASSPILTVGAKACLKQKPSTPRPSNFKQGRRNRAAEGDGGAALLGKRSACTSASEGDRDVSSSELESVSLEVVSEMSCSSCNESDKCSTSLGSSPDRCTDGGNVAEKGGQKYQPSPIWPTTSSTTFILDGRTSPIRPGDGQQGKAGHRRSLGFNGRVVGSEEFSVDPRDPSPLNTGTVRLQNDEAASLASECSTDVLVNVQPLSGVSQCGDQQPGPEDLPMHNKFTDWSGVGRQPPEPSLLTSNRGTPRYWPGWGEAGGCGSNVHSGRRAREIERLRQEREKVMATVHLGMSPPPLTVELTEAKLHYGLGETDTLLKMLEPQTASPSKQQLYDRHRRSIEGLKKEREERFQSCRRARSLSPSRRLSSCPQEAGSSPQAAAAIRQRCQEVMEVKRVPHPPRGAGLCPSDIEQLLRDYGRARVEAKMEIAKARERLRERTEQEKRRLQQQTVTREATDDPRRRTRISSSTLCTGSSQSLSSGPTSGYNSSNTVQLQHGSRAVVSGQDEEQKVWTRPAISGSQSVKTQRVWQSAQDVRLQPSLDEFEPPMTSTPSPLPCAWQRAASFGSSTSISSTYQDITCALLRRALAEVQQASSGDLNNLVIGKATAGWRYQGQEGDIQAYYKTSSSPSVHGFLAAGELNRPVDDLWKTVCQLSRSHMYNQSIRSVWTRALDDSTQLVHILTDPSTCHLRQPRDFCCISTESKQGGLCVLAMQSVFDESLPRPSVDAIRGELMPSCWVLQPVRQNGPDVTRVVYLLQVDLGTPSFPQHLSNTVARRQAAVISGLDSLLSS